MSIEDDEPQFELVDEGSSDQAEKTRHAADDDTDEREEPK